jgi:hypothetical protein
MGRNPLRVKDAALCPLLSFLKARVAELADAPDLGSGGQPWGFKSPLSHQSINRMGNQLTATCI